MYNMSEHGRSSLFGTGSVTRCHATQEVSHAQVNFRQSPAFYQDGKGHLGLDAYRMRSAEAIGKHWCLVFVAYSFLHLACLAASPTKGCIPVKTIGEACRQQAQALIEQ